MTTKKIGDLFAFSTQDGREIKIPKTALTGLDNPDVPAAQFFGSVILRGLELCLASQSFSHYADPQSGKLIKLTRTQIEITLP